MESRANLRSARIGGLRSEWQEIGGLGRLAVAGVTLAVIATLALGFVITSTTRHHLLDARASMLAASVASLPQFSGDTSPAEYAAFDVAVRINVLGGETARVKVWAPDGSIVYSDAEELIGERFALSQPAAKAFAGRTGTLVSDLTEPAHAIDKDRGELIEFYIPIRVDSDGSPEYVIEIEQDATDFNEAMGRITTTAWIAIGLTIMSLGLVMGIAAAARARELNRRRRQAERLLEQSFETQEQERRRVVGALHDDIGQPMYRLLYGLEGLESKLPENEPARSELSVLADTVRDMDQTLRAELRLLHVELAADAGLSTALEELVEITERETDLVVTLDVDLGAEPDAATRTEIYRAAREAITNVRKHAGAAHVTVRVRSDDRGASFSVDDDGTGSPGEPARGLGLTTMSDRFAALGGSIALERSVMGGTRLHGWVPTGLQEGT